MKTHIKTDIFQLVQCIPRGKVTTYGWIAQKLAIRDVRLVGWMLHQNKDTHTPCHRVVKKDGSLATGYAFGGTRKQRELLEQEGVIFAPNGKVCMTKCAISFS